MYVCQVTTLFVGWTHHEAALRKQEAICFIDRCLSWRQRCLSMQASMAMPSVVRDLYY